MTAEVLTVDQNGEKAAGIPLPADSDFSGGSEDEGTSLVSS